MSLVSYTVVASNHQEPYEVSSANPERCDDTDLIAEDSIHGVPVPIAFREILLEHHLRRNQRIFCFGILLLLSVIVLILFVFLLLCFTRVINKLTLQEYQNNQGLHMIPDYDTRTGKGILSLAQDKVAKGRYVETIQEYIEAYKKEQLTRANFTKKCGALEKPAHAWCRFPLDVFDAEGCGAKNRYGFDSGEPCFLLELKLQSSWTPLFSRNVTILPLKCDAYDQSSLRKNMDVKIISPPGNGALDGFPVNKIPSRAISDSEGRDVSDENGETLYDQPALFSEFRYMETPCFLMYRRRTRLERYHLAIIAAIALLVYVTLRTNRPNIVTDGGNHHVVLKESASAGFHGQDPNSQANLGEPKNFVNDQLPELSKKYEGGDLEDRKGSIDYSYGNDISASHWSRRKHIRFLVEIPATFNDSRNMSEQPEGENSANTNEIGNTNGAASMKTEVVHGRNDENVVTEEYANHLDMANDNEDNVMLHEFQNYPAEEMSVTNGENSVVRFDTNTSKLIRNSDDEPTGQRSDATKSDAAMISNVVIDLAFSSNKGTTEGVEIPAY